MRRAGLFGVTVAAIAITASGCSKTEGTKPHSSEAVARPNPVGTGGAGASLSDDEFVRDVALKNMAEVELSRMAVNRATSQEVKSFAQRMLDEHGAAGHKLKSVVSGQPIEWPGELDEKHKEIAEDLAEKQGAEFDREYIKAMVDSHQDLAAKLESRLDVQSLQEWKTAAAGRTDSKSLPDPNTAMRDVQVRPNKSGTELSMKINQWAAETYPVAQKHLDTARTLESGASKRSTN